MDIPKPSDFDFGIVFEDPVTSHAMLQMLVDMGVKLNVDHTKLTAEERKKLLWGIVKELEARENIQ